MNNNPDCHPDTPESGQQTIHIKELRRTRWNIGNIGRAQVESIRRGGRPKYPKCWRLVARISIGTDNYMLILPIWDGIKKNFCRFYAFEIYDIEARIQKSAKDFYEKKHTVPIFNISRK